MHIDSYAFREDAKTHRIKSRDRYRQLCVLLDLPKTCEDPAMFATEGGRFTISSRKFTATRETYVGVIDLTGLDDEVTLRDCALLCAAGSLAFGGEGNMSEESHRKSRVLSFTVTVFRE